MLTRLTHLGSRSPEGVWNRLRPQHRWPRFPAGKSALLLIFSEITGILSFSKVFATADNMCVPCFFNFLFLNEQSFCLQINRITEPNIPVPEQNRMCLFDKLNKPISFVQFPTVKFITKHGIPRQELLLNLGSTILWH